VSIQTITETQSLDSTWDDKLLTTLLALADADEFGG
jgi:hypothetical protein